MFCLDQLGKKPTLPFPALYFGSASSLEFFVSSVRTRERPVASKTVSDAISKECLRRQGGGRASRRAVHLFSAGKKNQIKLPGHGKYRNIQVAAVSLAWFLAEAACLRATSPAAQIESLMALHVHCCYDGSVTGSCSRLLRALAD